MHRAVWPANSRGHPGHARSAIIRLALFHSACTASNTSDDLIKQLRKQNIDATSTLPHHSMPQFKNPFHPTSPALDVPTVYRRKSSAFERSVGAAVGPGRVVTKQERLRREAERMDSAVGGLDGQIDQGPDPVTTHNWTAFKALVAADRRWSSRLNLEIDTACAPIDSQQPLGIAKRPASPQALLVVAIFFMLVFGCLYVLLEYLLFMTRASACSVTTVYVPVTYTVTAGEPVLSAQSITNDTSPTATSTSTTTSTTTVLETLTSTVADPSTSSTAAALSLTSSHGYAYTTNSAGITEWVNGISPTSGASTVVVTTTIVMRPVPPDDPAVTAQSAIEAAATVTPPAYTSTNYTFHNTDPTSTRTVTYTLSEVSHDPTITTTRTSLPGVGTSGWNSTASSDPTTVDPVSTMTSIRYFGAGDDTTSTNTMLITSTIAIRYTTTISPASGTSTGAPYVTTITALPVTISEGASGLTSSTSASPFNSSSISSSSTGTVVSNSSSVASAISTAPAAPGIPGYGSSSVLHTGTPSNSSISMTSAAVTTSKSTASAQTASLTPSILPSNASSRISVPSTRSLSSTDSVGAITGTKSSLTSVSTSVPLSGPLSATTITGATNASLTYHVSPSTARSTSPVATGPFSTASTLNTTSNGPPLSPASVNTASSKANASLSLAGYSTLVALSSLSAVNTSPSTMTHAKGGPISATATPKTTRVKGNPIQSANTASTTRAKGTPPNVASSSASSVSAINTFTSKTTRAKGSPLSSLRSQPSGMTTSVRSPGLTASTPGVAGPTSTSPVPTSPVSSASTLTSPASTLSKTASSSNLFPPTSVTTIPTQDCGEQGEFLLTFDDLPNFTPTNDNNTKISQAPPVFNPYHHLTFSDGFVYAPEPSEPYQPISLPHLAVFLANGSGKVKTPYGDLVKPGEIGDGPRDSIPAFWFDAFGAFFGCDNAGPSICTMVFKAYVWDASKNAESLLYRHSASIPPCTTMQDLNCQLQQVDFPSTFQNLTGLQIQAFVDQGRRTFYMDNLNLRWSNSSCAAGLLRQSSQ